MTTLFDALLSTARELDAIHEGIATANGTTTTLIDIRLAQQGWQDDDFNGGRIFLIENADAPGGAPQGEFKNITDFVAATSTFTVDNPFSVATGSADWYGASTNRYGSSGLLISKINEALREAGDVPTVDTSLTTAANTLEYNLPVAAKRDLRQVWLARSLAAPWDWEPQLTVRAEWSTANAAAALLFPVQPRAGYKIKLVYMAPHGHVSDATDLISDYISMDWLGAAAALKCARFRLSVAGSDDKTLTPLINDLMTREQSRRRHRRMPLPQTFPVLAPNLDGALP